MPATVSYQKSVHFQKHSGHLQLFIPGPTEVAPEVLAAFAQPQIGHRTPEFKQLLGDIGAGIQRMLNTQAFVFFAPTSATGMWEGVSKNLVKKRALNLYCGSFGERWHDATVSNGIPGDTFGVELGKGISVDFAREKLKTADYDVLTIVHSETATSALMPIPELVRMVRAEFPEVLVCVDGVSSVAGIPIDFDAWDLDVLLFGYQKCFAMPAGMATAVVSERAMERARSKQHRGYLLDFVLGKKKADQGETISTPNIAAMLALRFQLARMEAEGFENRYARHRAMAETTWRYVEQFWDYDMEPGYRSLTVTSVKNSRGADIGAMLSELKRRGLNVSNGYGPLKGKSFRVGHMGEWGVEDMVALFNEINDVLGLPAFE